MSITNSVQAKLERDRQELLDLGLRNKLISYKPLKTSGVEIEDELPERVYQILVQDSRSMYFLPKPEPEVENNENNTERTGWLWTDEDNEEEDTARQIGNRLQTSHSPTELQKRLLNTYYTARTYIEEQGVNTLYLALGMLQWYEPQSSDITPRQAPLILIPVELNRNSVRSPFHIRYTGEDLGPNLSLQAKLESEFGVSLPSLPEDDELDLQRYFQEVDLAVRQMPRWAVNVSAIALGFFSFAKFLMYHDLDARNWPEESPPSQHRILQHLLETGFQERDSIVLDSDHIDQHITPAQTHHVVDADSSQTLAILDVSHGRNLVIQGPPGTGKSQTITNLIAEAIGKGKRVLFVAEKMAALEVVKRKLDQVGLGDACLELHSHKTNKKAVLDELQRTLELGQPRATAFEQELQSLINQRDRLNRYCEAVNTPISDSNIRPYQAFGTLLTVERRLSGVNLPALDMQRYQHSASQFKQGLETTGELQALLRRMGIPINHPFWGSQCKIFLPNDRAQLEQLAGQASETVMALGYSSAQLAQHLRLQPPDTLEAVERLISVARHALDAPELEGIAVKAAEWLTQNENLETGLCAGERLVSLYEEYNRLLKEYEGVIPETWEQDVLQMLTVLRALKHSSTELALDLRLSAPDTLEVVESVIHVARRVLDAPNLEGVAVKATEWVTRSEDLASGLRAGERLSHLSKEYDDVLIPEAWGQDVLDIRKELAAYGSKWYRFLLSKYRRARNELAGLCTRPLPKPLDARLEIVDAILEVQRARLRLEKIQELGQQLFGLRWQGESSNWIQLQTVFRYLTSGLPKEVVDYLASNPDLETLRTMVTTVEEHRSGYERAILPFMEGIQAPKSLEGQLRIVDALLKVRRTIDAVLNEQQGRPYFEKIQEAGKQLLGTYWHEEASDWTQLQTITQYLLVLHELSLNSDSETLRTAVSILEERFCIIDLIRGVKRIVDEICEALKRFENLQQLGQGTFRR